MTDEQSGASLNFLLAAFIIIAVAYFQSTFRRIDELGARIALLDGCVHQSTLHRIDELDARIVLLEAKVSSIP